MSDSLFNMFLKFYLYHYRSVLSGKLHIIHALSYVQPSRASSPSNSQCQRRCWIVGCEET